MLAVVLALGGANLAQAQRAAVIQSVSVEEFLDAPLDSTHLDQLQSRCRNLLENGSGVGACSCGVGDIAVPTFGPFPPGRPPFAGTFQVSYYDVGTSVRSSAAGYGGPLSSGGAGDGTVRIVNPTAQNGTLCAMIYVFDDFEEIQTCCGCPVTPDGLRTLSVINDLTSNFGVNKGNLNAGVIEIVSSTLNFTPGNPPTRRLPPGVNGLSVGEGPVACDPTGDPGVNPAQGLHAWMTHDELLHKGPCC